MALADDLERIAAAASEHGSLSGVLAAEPALGRRFYLVAFGEDDARRWALFDDEGSIVDRRDDVRDAASIVALCELAAEVAGEQLEGIEEADEAALALERAVGVPPRVASPAYLDTVGAATVALGETSSAFSQAIRAGTTVVDAFVKDVERGYLVELR